MLDYEVLKTEYEGLVGFEQPTDNTYPALTAPLNESDSGIFIQRVHPLCTVENIFNTAPQVDDFNTWLQKLYDGAVVQVFNDIMVEKKMESTYKAVVDSLRLYDGIGRQVDRVIKRGRFVGFEIIVSPQEGLQVAISKIGFQVDTIQTGMDLYLYHSSQLDPLLIHPINITKVNSFSWFTIPDAILSGVSESNDSDGVFYLGYYEDELTGQVFYRRQSWDTPCSTCNNYDVSAFNRWSKYITIRPISVASSRIQSDGTLFDLNYITYEREQNWGMNLSISVYCNLTAFFSQNKAIVAPALSMRIAIQILNLIAFSTRINAIAEQSFKLAHAELDTRKDSGSFYMQYYQTLKATNMDLSGINSACLPCLKKAGITRKAI